ncbi:tRNA (adenosine(37)-N6)-threonylcarbamoyltransferase complex dimerization subunit type 1 TsaB [Pseudorhodobacter sp. MZDSW-24AT]|uniref:tRNA (adenosine(37)-N6)-threonylcarbamoyltransferase complex dimerization subunit type 1 TsaB n=1 Tax=Pseudorhodobacter sp. MZDSW-24AT TaxID=2052957 RepID=UPI0018E176F2|nr:tRNA (adenosine(37)-N6)-threonylcarbamoyltransferase complex dimerization subunit type 1 TsaB [Pseudorhodobacter sp. MZDSW-24AT]
MPPDIVLAFDTSAAHCAAALLLPDGSCLIRQEEMAKGQAERLLPLLDALLAEAGLHWGDLSGIGVGTGPGNFTGVRISVAAARGLALSLGIPAIGVTRLEALAHGLPHPVTVVEDARRDEAYVQSFRAEGADPARLVALAELKVAGPVTGSAAAGLQGPVLPAAMPLVEATARLAAQRLNSPQPRPAPFYLRGADAAPPSDPPPVILDD